MSTLPRRRIRLKCDAAKETSFTIKDVSTTQTPELWKGNDCQFELGFFFKDVLILDVSNLVSLTLNIRQSSATGNLLATKTITSFSTITDATWAAGTAQNALVAFTGQELNILTGDHFLSIGIVTNDTPGRSATLGATKIKIAEDGIGDEADAEAVDGTAYTKTEADARYVQAHADQSWKRRYNGRDYHYIESTGLWYPEVAEIKDGIPILTLGAGESL